MRLETIFIIAVFAIFGTLSVVSVRAEPLDIGSEAPVLADRPSDVEITDVCREAADLCSDGGRFCHTHAELCRRIVNFCQENPEQCRSLVQFCRTHQNFCERVIEFCTSHDVRCRTLLTCMLHPDRCHDRPADRRDRVRISDRPASDRFPADVADPLIGTGE